MQHAKERSAAPGGAQAEDVKYRILFEASSDCILVLDRDGRLLDMNHRVCSILGFRREDLLGEAFTRILGAQALARLYPRPAQLQVERRTVRGEHEVQCRDGLVRHVEYVASPLPDGQVLLVVRDVSDRKRLEQERSYQQRILERCVSESNAELQALNRELESFSYSVSHDLRSPLRNMRGVVSVLRKDFGALFSGEALDCLECIERNGQRMETLIDDLLAFSQARHGPMSGAMVEMRLLAEAAIAEHRPAWGGHASVIVGELPGCAGDPGLLRQVWDNLLGNAFKYSAKVVRPRIEVGGARSGATLEYWVKDNGAGFDMAAAGKLFQPFHRLHTEREFSGTGIGLATVKRIVERHGGGVSAQAEPGNGASFRFTLPATQAAAEANAVPQSAPERGYARRRTDRRLRGV